MCLLSFMKPLHMFWDCRVACIAWDFSIGVINMMHAKLGHNWPRKPLDWRHGVFGK